MDVGEKLRQIKKLSGHYKTLPHYFSYNRRLNLPAMLKYLLTGVIKKSDARLWDEDYYRKVQLQALSEPDLLAFHIAQGSEIRCSPHPGLCPPYHILRNYKKNYWGRDVLLACLQDHEEPSALDFHGHPPAGQPFAVKDLAHTEAFKTAKSNGIPILTSIGPNRLAEQRQSIDTWLKQGFMPVAVNYTNEIDELKPHFPGVEFLPARRDSRPIIGRPRVLLNDLCDYARTLGHTSPHGVVGVVNSDVGLYALNIQKLLTEASDGLIFSRRVEVSAHVHDDGIIYDNGYDAVFFAANTFPDFPELPFALGETWWDLIWPMYALLCGVPIKAAVPVLCFHTKHAVNWSEESWLAMGKAAFEFLEPHFIPERQSCPEFYAVLSKAKKNIHHPVTFWLEFARLMNHILNTVPYIADVVQRK